MKIKILGLSLLLFQNLFSADESIKLIIEDDSASSELILTAAEYKKNKVLPVTRLGNGVRLGRIMDEGLFKKVNVKDSMGRLFAVAGVSWSDDGTPIYKDGDQRYIVPREDCYLPDGVELDESWCVTACPFDFSGNIAKLLPDGRVKIEKCPDLKQSIRAEMLSRSFKNRIFAEDVASKLALFKVMGQVTEGSEDIDGLRKALYETTVKDEADQLLGKAKHRVIIENTMSMTDFYLLKSREKLLTATTKFGAPIVLGVRLQLPEDVDLWPAGRYGVKMETLFPSGDRYVPDGVEINEEGVVVAVPVDNKGRVARLLAPYRVAIEKLKTLKQAPEAVELTKRMHGMFGKKDSE